MSTAEPELPTWEHVWLDAERVREEARDLRERAEVQRKGAQRAQRLSRLITVHFVTSFAAYDLARELGEPVEVTVRPDGADAEVRVTEGHTRALVHIRDWARQYGLEAVELTVFGKRRTLTP
jgi:hypothetical protein